MCPLLVEEGSLESIGRQTRSTVTVNFGTSLLPTVPNISVQSQTLNCDITATLSETGGDDGRGNKNRFYDTPTNRQIVETTN